MKPIAFLILGAALGIAATDTLWRHGRAPAPEALNVRTHFVQPGAIFHIDNYKDSLVDGDVAVMTTGAAIRLVVWEAP